MGVRAKDIMRRNVVVVREDTPLWECAHLFCERHISGMPVVDADEALIGIISQADIIRWQDRRTEPRPGAPGRPCAPLEPLGPQPGLVRDAMSRQAACVDEEAPVDSVVRVMLGRRIHRVVVTSGGAMTGIISTMDVVELVSRQAACVRSALGAKREYSDLYSNKHERLLLRVEHIERIKVIQRLHEAHKASEYQDPLTVGDVVNACLDFVFEHAEEFQKLGVPADIRSVIAEEVYQHLVSLPTGEGAPAPEATLDGSARGDAAAPTRGAAARAEEAAARLSGPAEGTA